MIRVCSILALAAAVGASLGCSGHEPLPDEAPRALVEKGRSAAKAGDYRMAVSYYSRALAEDPEFAEAYNERGKSNVQLRLAPGEGHDVRLYELDALNDFTQAVQKNPSFAEAYFNRAMVLASRAQYKMAVEDLLNVVRYNTQDAEPHRWLGELYEQKFEDRSVAAMEHYEKYVDLGGTNPAIREKVRIWKEARIPSPAGPLHPAKPATAEDEQKAVEMHARAMDLLGRPDKGEAIQILENLIATYGNTRYVQSKLQALQAVISAFKKKDAPK